MVKVFKKDVVNKSVVEIIKETCDVGSDGTVSFKSRNGRGSGKKVEIPGNEFDEFVAYMIKTQENHNELVKKQKAMDIQVIGAQITTNNKAE